MANLSLHTGLCNHYLHNHVSQSPYMVNLELPYIMCDKCDILRKKEQAWFEPLSGVVGPIDVTLNSFVCLLVFAPCHYFIVNVTSLSPPLLVTPVTRHPRHSSPPSLVSPLSPVTSVTCHPRHTYHPPSALITPTTLPNPRPGDNDNDKSDGNGDKRRRRRLQRQRLGRRVPPEPNSKFFFFLFSFTNVPLQ
jgi:hypothetical protein